MTSEHLKYGNSDALCEALASLLSCIFSAQIVSHNFYTGIISPISKEPSVNPCEPVNYHPITLSSTFSKILEAKLIPEDTAAEAGKK